MPRWYLLTLVRLPCRDVSPPDPNATQIAFRSSSVENFGDARGVERYQVGAAMFYSKCACFSFITTDRCCIWMGWRGSGTAELYPAEIAFSCLWAWHRLALGMLSFTWPSPGRGWGMPPSSWLRGVGNKIRQRGWVPPHSAYVSGFLGAHKYGSFLAN